MDYSFLDMLPVGILVIQDIDYQIIYANRSLRNTFNISSENFSHAGNTIYASWETFFSDDIKKKILHSISEQKQVNNNDEFHIECEIIDGCGKTLWVLASGKKVTEDSGNIVHYITITNITDQKSLQIKLENITESIPGGLVILEAHRFLTISYANNGYYSLIGYDKNELHKKFRNRAAYTVYLEDLPIVIDTLLNRLDRDQHFHIETRLVTKWGNIIWVSCDGIFIRSDIKDKNDKIYCVMVDITNQHLTIKNLEQERKLNQIIQNLSNDMLFNLDLSSRTMTFSDNAVNRLGLSKRLDHFPESFLQLGLVAQKELAVFINSVLAMYDGSKSYAEFHLKEADGEGNWYRMEYDFLYDDQNNPECAVGKLVNINSQKLLESQATLDSLTKLLNKSNTESRIIEVFQETQLGQSHALFLIDVDNFKGVNDTLGHHFGDVVLCDIADNLRKLFAKTDCVLGRIGGDEFAVLLCNIKNVSDVIKRAESVADAFRHTFSGESNDYKISGSVGVAFFPLHGTDYEDLYVKADYALYHSKHKGKDCCTVYSNRLRAQRTISNVQPMDETRHYLNQYFREDLVYQIFDLLYETKDMFTSINKVLEITAKNFKADRAYILQPNNETVFINTYQFCTIFPVSEMNNCKNSDATVLKKQFQHQELDYIIAHIEHEGVFACNSTNITPNIPTPQNIPAMLERQQVRSMLLCSFHQKGQIKGLIGIEDISKERTWTGKEISWLSYISKILAAYLPDIS